MAGIVRSAALGIVCAALSGCAGPIFYSVPEKLGTRGLLVAYVYSDNYPGAMHGAPVVDNYIHDGAQNEGYVVLPLDPGEHTLNVIYQLKSTLTVPTAIKNLNLTVRDASAFAIERKFRIEAGRITNLGVIAVRSPQAVGTTSNVLYLDNTRDMQAVIASAFPSLYASLASPEFLTSGPFESAAKVQDLRYAAVSSKFSSRRWQAEHPDATYVTGAYGAIARVRRTESAPTLQLIPTETLRDLSACGTSASYAACVISDSQLLFVESDKAAIRTLPAGMSANSVHVVGDREIVLIDHAMRFYVSADKGATWSKAGDFTLTKPITAGIYLPDNKNRFGIEVGQDGTYFYSIDVDGQSSALVSRSRDGTLARMPLPLDASHLQRIKQTDAGLFAASALPALWLLPRGESAWQARKLPQSNCSQFAFGDRTGRHVELLCGDDLIWTSKDGGVTWNRIFKPQSLFAER